MAVRFGPIAGIGRIDLKVTDAASPDIGLTEMLAPDQSVNSVA